MAEIIKAYRQQVPALRFIGKKYGEADRVNGGFGKQWDDFHANGWFGELEALVDGGLGSIFEDGDAYVGLMRWKEGEPFQYWIGIFMPAETEAPEGWKFVDFDASSLGVCWIYGPESELYKREGDCGKRLEQDGVEIINGADGACWFFERYACPRFTEPDEKGNVILDICFFVK